MQTRVRFYIVAAIFLVFFYLMFQMIRPFFDSLMWALVFSVVFFIPHGWLLEKTGRQNFSASLMLVVITFGILVPMFFLAQLLVTELKETYKWVETALPGLREFDPADVPVLSTIWEYVSGYFSYNVDELERDFLSFLKGLSRTMVNYFSFAFVNVISFGFNFVVMLIALFFFFRDGQSILGKISNALPFDERERLRFFSQIKDMIIATLYGGLSVAVVQGLVGGTLFWLLGIHAPALWGTVMAFLAFVPVVGAGLVWVPAVIYFLIIGSTGKAFILLLFGGGLISMADYVLRPIVIGNRTRMNTLLIFLSVLGGLQYFGFVGIVVGPMVALTCLALINIYVERSVSENIPPAPEDVV